MRLLTLLATPELVWELAFWFLFHEICQATLLATSVAVMWRQVLEAKGKTKGMNNTNYIIYIYTYICQRQNEQIILTLKLFIGAGILLPLTIMWNLSLKAWFFSSDRSRMCFGAVQLQKIIIDINNKHIIIQSTAKQAITRYKHIIVPTTLYIYGLWGCTI